MVTEEKLREISKKIDELFASGKKDKGQELLESTIAEAKDNTTYRLFFEGELAHYLEDNETAREKHAEAVALKPYDHFLLRNYGVILGCLGRGEEAIALYDQALKINPDDYDSLRQKGVSLSKFGRGEEAIALYDQALKINPDDNYSLCQKGVSLSNHGREEEAIALYDQALKINPDDYASLRNKGISLSNLDRREKAIALYDQALKINPDDYDSLRNKGISLFTLGNIADAYKLIRQALEKNPGSERLQKDASFVFSHLSDKDKAKLDDTTEKPDSTNVGGLRGFIQTVREEFVDVITKFEKEKEKNTRHLHEFIGADSKLNPDSSVFLVLRKWNSYTPALPLDGGEKSVGGGYFIYHQGRGTVIDPGYNFIENFHRIHGRLLDIDNIIITHAHNDHTIDFESLLSLFYQAYKDKNIQTVKKVNLYLNQGAMLKFASLIDWRSRKFIGEIFTLNPGDTYRLIDNSTIMTVLPAYHDEIVTRYYAVGLHFAFSFDEAGKRSLLLTSDTGLYPPEEKDGPGKDQQSSKTEIHELYKLISEDLVSDVDILVPHLGSIGERELSAVEDMNWQPEDILYGNHLGVLGVLRLVSAIKPKLALVSEFGEDLKTFRQDLLRLMQKVMQKVIPDDSVNILPADLPFIYNLREGTVFCVDTEEMAAATEIKFEEEDGTFYYYCNKEKRDKFTSLKGRYENTTQIPYLKKDA